MGCTESKENNTVSPVNNVSKTTTPLYSEKFNGDKCEAELNKVVIRINIHRQK